MIPRKKSEAVVGQSDVLGEITLPGRVRNLMAEVCQPGAPGQNGPRRLDGLRDAHVGRMRCVPKCIEHEDLDAAGRIHSLGREVGAVGVVGQQAASATGKDVPGAHKAAMGQIDRGDGGLAEEKRAIDRARGEPEIVLPGAGFVEGKPEGLPEAGHGRRGGMDRHLAILHLAEAAQIIEPHDVIRVRMGEECCIHPPDPLPQALLSEVGRRVDHGMEIGESKENRGPCPVVPRIGGMTDLAGTADHRNSLGGSGSEKSKFQGGHAACSDRPHAGIVMHMSAMLRSLRIRNLALVEALEWDLPAGFTAVTGETGAGKSVILGALKFLLGERADRGLVRAGASTASLEAVFHILPDSPVHGLLEESGIESCEEGELILKRTIAAEGSGRQFLNGSPCNLSLLRDLGSHLVDLHGPHDHQSLFSRTEQTLLLDRFCDALGERESFQEARKAVAASRRALEDLLAENGGADLEDRLREEVREITEAGLMPGEEEPLLERHRAASNSRRLIELSAAAVARIEDEERGASAALAETARLLRDLSRIDARSSPHLERLESISGDLDGLASDLRDHADSIELDAGELGRIEERIDLLATLRRKYGPSLEDVITRGSESSSRLERLSGHALLRQDAETRLEACEKELTSSSVRLGAKRKKGAERLSKAVVSQLSDLGFRQAGFEIALEQLPEPGPDGGELAEFLFAPNPGEPPRSLRTIASSGEISRVMLALKSALADQDRIPLLVFDEIDANVGGEIATRVASKMRELGTGHQVLCITHLPQVAAAASSQYVVTKSVKDGRTETVLETVRGSGRVSEIARMLGGITESAKAHASALLAGDSGKV